MSKKYGSNGIWLMSRISYLGRNFPFIFSEKNLAHGRYGSRPVGPFFLQCFQVNKYGSPSSPKGGIQLTPIPPSGRVNLGGLYE
jgi:hypothetical protein